VQILEIVAIIQIENLKIEAEKGFRRTLIDPELVDPNLEINFVKELGGARHWVKATSSPFQRKGNSLNDTIRVHKESGVTHGADLTIFSSNWRVFCSPSMAFAASSVH
jgi:hypothetical protein